MDVVGAAVGLVAAAPVLGAAALLIRREDGGPVLFRQERVGKDGASFEVLKLRTMVVDAERQGAGFAVAAGDDRITRVGDLLRRTSLDELPQLWNVLRGDMSLVGPRPTLRYQVEQYTERQRRRLEVRPGLTGWAQVHGRTSLPWSERIELDVWYVEHRSLALDLRILVRTVGVLLRREGVYKGADRRLGRPVREGRRVNVLLTCVGLRVDVVQAFRDAVERRGEGGVVVGTDMQELAPAAHFCDRFERMPIATDATYADRLLELAERHDVRCVVPCSEFDLIVLADTRQRFRELGAEVFIPDPTPTRQTVDKLEMARFLDASGIPSPRTFAPDELPDDLRFPVLVKMREGMGSNHIHHCKDLRELEFFLGYARVASMVQEVCDGPEFSIDLLCDVDGRCLEAIPRTMIQSKGGEQIKGTTIADPELVEVGRLVSEALPLRGFGTVQCFRTAPGRHEITDVNPRVGGAFPLPLAAGGEYPALVLAMAAGERPEPRLGSYRAGVTLSRFFHQIVLEGPEGAREARLDRLSLPARPAVSAGPVAQLADPLR